MSFAMDDLSLSYGLETTRQARQEETRMVEKAADVEKNSDSVKQEPEFSDVYEKTESKPTQKEKTFEEIQQKSTAIDITKESLKKIASVVEDIKKAVNEEKPEETKQKIDENYKKIQQIAKETSLEEIKVSEIKNIEINTEEGKKEAVKTLENITNTIRAKEKELAAEQDDFIKQVNKNSLVELKLQPKAEAETEKEIEVKIKEPVSPEKLKEDTQKAIKEEPEKSIKMHVKHIDRNLLLAMMSLKVAG